MPHRAKRHHTTPKLLLRGFADDDGILVKHDLKTKTTYPNQPIKTVVREANFYSITDVDDQLSPLVEELLCRIEDKAGPLLARLSRAEPNWTLGEWPMVALFVALQHVRGPGERKLWLETGQSLARLRGLVDGLPPIVDDRDSAVAKMLRLAIHYGDILASGYSPVVLRWPRRSLLTSDNPVLLISDGTSVARSVRASGGMFMAVDDATGLLLWNHECRGIPPQRQARPSEARARELNQAIVAQSVRQVLWHPEATSEQLLGPSFEFPPFREKVAPAYVDEQCRKIAQVLEWAETNPDQPHPLAAIPPIRMDPEARPLSPEMRRRLTASGLFGLADRA